MSARSREVSPGRKSGTATTYLDTGSIRTETKLAKQKTTKISKLVRLSHSQCVIFHCGLFRTVVSICTFLVHSLA